MTADHPEVVVPPRFDGLTALFVNATLKRSPEPATPRVWPT
jgi:hypothetical protein